MRIAVQLRLTTTESEPAIRAEPGSFRDPGGRIYWYGERVLRTVMPTAAKDFEFVEASGLIPSLVERGMLIPQSHLSLELLGEAAGVERVDETLEVSCEVAAERIVVHGRRG